MLISKFLELWRGRKRYEVLQVLQVYITSERFYTTSRNSTTHRKVFTDHQRGFTTYHTFATNQTQRGMRPLQYIRFTIGLLHAMGMITCCGPSIEFLSANNCSAASTEAHWITWQRLELINQSESQPCSTNTEVSTSQFKTLTSSTSLLRQASTLNAHFDVSEDEDWYFTVRMRLGILQNCQMKN